MKILHITPHLGGGVGTVICDWMTKEIRSGHMVVCLDSINDTARDMLDAIRLPFAWNQRYTPNTVMQFIEASDVVLVHYWDHPTLAEFFSKPIPECRLVFWCHKNIPYSQKELDYPDLWLDTSPVQGHGRYIWSTGNMDRFFKIKPKEHKGFNIGYVGTVDYKKLHSRFMDMCITLIDLIPDVHFTIVGEKKIDWEWDSRFTFTGKVDDVAPYLAEMDVFGYPLRPDHYGTCEIALGEAMAAGVVPVVMDNPAEKIIIQPNVDGLLARDEKDYILCIKSLYKSIIYRKDFYPEAARNRAKQLYSIDNMIKQWDEVFEEMVKEPKRSREVL